MGVRSVRPPNVPHYVKTSQPSANHHANLCSLFYISTHIYLKLSVVLNGKGGRSGLSPDPWFHCIIACDHNILHWLDRLAWVMTCNHGNTYDPWVLIYGTGFLYMRSCIVTGPARGHTILPCDPNLAYGTRFGTV